MKYLTSSYNGEAEELCIAPIGDVHIGSPHADLDMVKRHLETIDKHRDTTRIILMGDILETATKDSVGAGWAELSKEERQEEQEAILNQHLMKAKNMLWDFRDIIDGVIDGNHELRVYKQSGLKLMDTFSEMMGIRDKYMGYQGIVKYAWNKRAYDVSIWHGAGGGRKTGSTVNKLEGQAEYIVADLYLMGHTHKLHMSRKVVYIPDQRNMKIQTREQVFLNTGHALNYGYSYAEAAGLPPSDKGFPFAYMSGRTLSSGVREKHIRVEL